VLATGATTPPVGAGRLGSNTVGIVIAGLNPFYLPLLRGIEDVGTEHGTLVLIADAHDSATLADAMIRRLIARGVDGIIAVSIGGLADGQPPESPTLEVPIVDVGQPDRTGSVLLFDSRRGGYLATRHLADHGHDKIGIITPTRSWPSVREVYRGYVDALEQLAGASPELLVSEVSEFSVDAGRRGLAQLLELPDPPSAVFAVDEVLALGALREARARGIDVPGDLALVGYTDSPLSVLVEPALTMVSVPAREIGVRAMRTLQGLISGRKPRRRRSVLDVELVVRRQLRPSPEPGGGRGDRSALNRARRHGAARSGRLLQGHLDLSLVEGAHDSEIEARACAIKHGEEVVERLEWMARRCDEQIAALEAGAVGGTPLLDSPDEQACALGQADCASELPRRVCRRERDPQLAVPRALAAREFLDA